MQGKDDQTQTVETTDEAVESVETSASKTEDRLAATTVPTSLNDGDDIVVLGGDEKSEAFRGMKGKIYRVHLEKGFAHVKLDNIPNPVEIPVDYLMPGLGDDAADPAALAGSKRPRVRFVANTSGGLLIIPDLRSAGQDGEGLALQPGEKIDLLQLFEAREINKSVGLVRAMKKTSTNNNLSLLVEIESLDDPLPEGAIVKPLVEKHKPGDRFEDEPNEYDDKLAEDLRKEEERNDKLKKNKLAQRRTTQSGRGSSTLGR